MTYRKSSLNTRHIRTLKKMSYSSRRPRWLLLLSTQNRKMNLVGTIATGQYNIGKKPPGQTLTLIAWIHGVFLRCLNVLGCCWWCNDVEHILFSAFGCLTAVQHYLNATIYLSIVSGLVLLFSYWQNQFVTDPRSDQMSVHLSTLGMLEKDHFTAQIQNWHLEQCVML